MDKKELMEYIKDAIALESDIVTQAKIMDETSVILANKEPKLKLLENPDKPFPDYLDLEPFRFRFSNDSPQSAALAGSVFVILFGILCLSYGGPPAMGIICFIIAILLTIPFIYGKVKYKNEYQRLLGIYNTKLEQYNQKVAYNQKRNCELKTCYYKQHADWKQSFSEITAYLSSPYENSQMLLKRHYERDIIYPKYCNLPALTSIYEYFITGRCDELTGPHGAYNLYEDELRKDTVISQLNAVIENLEQIKQNQYMLYQQVKAIQENTAAITYELQQIKGYTIQIAQLSALNAYYAALNERNTRITMYYHL